MTRIPKNMGEFPLPSCYTVYTYVGGHELWDCAPAPAIRIYIGANKRCHGGVVKMLLNTGPKVKLFCALPCSCTVFGDSYNTSSQLMHVLVHCTVYTGINQTYVKGTTGNTRRFWCFTLKTLSSNRYWTFQTLSSIYGTYGYTLQTLSSIYGTYGYTIQTLSSV